MVAGHATVWGVGWRRGAMAAMAVCVSWSWLSSAGIIGAKFNWEFGTYTTNVGTGDVTYNDAHVKFATRGKFLGVPAPTTADGGFAGGKATITHGTPDETMTIDWNVGGGAPLVGKNHVGGTFSYNDLNNPLGIDVRVLEAYLTGANAVGIGIISPLQRLDVPGPTGYRDVRNKSVDWDFLNSFPLGSPTVTFSDVNFYKMATEPALSDLTAANFASLGATFLQSEPGFSVDPGLSHYVHIPGVDTGEWLLASYKTTWLDPVLSAGTAGPVTVTMPQWVATLVGAGPAEDIPEPATLALLAAGGLALLRRRTRRLARRD